MFFEKNVKKCLKVCKIRRETPVSESQTSALQLYRKKTPAQVFSCEFCEIIWNALLTEHLRATVLSV